MLHKNSFEPKDARILSYYEDDEVDDELAELGVLDSSRPGATRKKKTTGTQALAEFLSTTSPEEFQRTTQQTSHPVEPSSTNFFKLRKSKRTLINRRSNSNNGALVPSTKTASFSNALSSALSNSAMTMNRKNYIEIVPKTQQQQQQQHSSSPMLPQTGYNKKRDSSLYSGSLRHSVSIRSQLSGTTASNGRMIKPSLTRQDTATTLSTMASGHINKRKQPSLNYQMTTIEAEHKESRETTNEADDQQKRTLTKSLLLATSDMDVIEAGLVQRLERCTLSGFEKPSDTVAHLLVNEHLRALDVSLRQQEHANKTEMVAETKKRARHVQVQTMEQGEQPLATTTTTTLQQTQSIPPITLITESNSSSSIVSGSQLPSPASDSGVIDGDHELTTTSCSQATTIDRLEKELAKEKKHRQRLESSLNNSLDHFEVLSGLAYKKLREIWEEKLKWEKACLELNEQLMMSQQQQQEQPQEKQQNHQGSVDMEDINSVMGKDSVSVVS